MTLKTALLVDDSKLARITLKKLLEKRNLDVTMCASAREALDWLKSNKTDVIFMDHLMPEMDGLEALAVIKKDPALAPTPVVMCTGKEGDNYEETVRQAGAIGFLAKPPEPDQLESVLKRVQNAIEMGTVIQPTAPDVAAENDTGAIQDQLEALEKRLLEVLHERMDLAKAEFEAHKQELIGSLPDPADSESVSHEFNARLEAIDKQTSDIGSLFNDFESKVSNLSGELDNLKESVSEPAPDGDLLARLEALEASSSQTSSDASGLSEDAVSSIVRDILTKDLGLTDGRLEAMQADIGKIETAVEKMSGESSEPDLTALSVEMEQKVDELVTAVDEKLSANLQQIEQRLENMTQDTTERPDISMDQVRLEISELAAKEVEQRLETVWTQQQASMSDLKDTISEKVSQAMAEQSSQAPAPEMAEGDEELSVLASELASVREQLDKAQQRNMAGLVVIGIGVAAALAKVFGLF